MKCFELGSEGHPEFLEFSREVAIMEDIAESVGAAYSGAFSMDDEGRVNGQDCILVEYGREPIEGDAERYRDLSKPLPLDCILCEVWRYIFDPGEIFFKRKEMVSRGIAVQDE